MHVFFVFLEIFIFVSATEFEVNRVLTEDVRVPRRRVAFVVGWYHFLGVASCLE